MSSEPRERLFREILNARRRIYSGGSPTPTERLPLSMDAEVFVKREDLSAVNSYKWRGAYNRMAVLSDEERARGVVAASAGNHAQGVALAARRMGIQARIYMPLSTPRTKQSAVRAHGGDNVDVVLVGDSYDDASAAAKEALKSDGGIYVHPYDDYYTMGGQGTLADEVVMSGHGPFDIAFLQIGGGGMAAAVACWLKYYFPGIRIVGVEGVHQASMKAAVAAGRPVTLDYVDVFCDGTAVKRAGDLTFPLCRDLIDEFVTVTNEQVCAAIQALWEGARCLAEPSGAMGLAGLLKYPEYAKGRRALVVLCGANVDFGQLPWIARHAGIGASRRRYYRFEIGERPGALVSLLESICDGANIIEFQYGKTDETRAFPVLGLELPPPGFALLERRCAEQGIPFADVTSQEDVEFRLIHYKSELFRAPRFIRLEFPERAGALRDFLHHIRGTANVCYFNYVYTGERVGRALIGFEFESEERSIAFNALLATHHGTYQEIDPRALSRIL